MAGSPTFSTAFRVPALAGGVSCPATVKTTPFPLREVRGRGETQSSRTMWGDIIGCTGGGTWGRGSFRRGRGGTVELWSGGRGRLLDHLSIGWLCEVRFEAVGCSEGRLVVGWLSPVGYGAPFALVSLLSLVRHQLFPTFQGCSKW